MGLDQYLYRTSKRRIEAGKKFEEMRQAYLKEGNALLDKPHWKEFLDSLPKTTAGHYDYSAMTKEQKKQNWNMRRAMRRVAKKHDLVLDKHLQPIFSDEYFGLTEADGCEEIGYWRKNWNLHKFIIDKFWADKENDNLVDVFLTRNDIERIIHHGYIGGFEEALSRWDDDYVVFYHPWY